MTVHVPGYVTQRMRMMSHEKLLNNVQKKLPMTPPTRKHELRVILTWGDHPSDLDLHGVSSNDEHVYYGNKTRGRSFQLDKDDRLGNGFETITLRDKQPNSTYWFCVHHFSGAGDLASSGARIEIHSLDDACKEAASLSPSEPVTISVPRITSSGEKGQIEVWQVFSLQTDSAGRTRLGIHNKIAQRKSYLSSSVLLGALAVLSIFIYIYDIWGKALMILALCVPVVLAHDYSYGMKV